MRGLERVAVISILTAAIGGTSVAALKSVQPAQPVAFLCAGADRVVKAALPGGACGPGERAIGSGAAAGGAADKDKDALDARIRQLESRIKDLEAERERMSGTGTVMRAPFTVLNKDGRPIFRVGQYSEGGAFGAFVFNAAGTPAALMSAGPGGGIVRVISDSDPNTSVGIGAGAAVGGPGLLVTEANKKRLQLGKTPSGHFGLLVNSPNEVVLAAIGESQGGTGLAIVNDTSGKLRASMQLLSTGGSMMGVWNPAGQLLASLSQGDSGGGKLQLTDAAGTPMVEGGSAGGRGMVRTGPMPMAMLPGIPGSFIIGRK